MFLKIFGKKVKNNQDKAINLIYAFTDLKGRKYYHFANPMQDLNVARYIEFYMPLVNEYFSNIRLKDLEEYFKDAEKYKRIEQFMAATKMLEQKVQFSREVFIVYEIMAVLYLREDEQNTPIHEDFVKEKAKDIRDVIIQSGGGGSGFFQCPLLKEFLKSASISVENWRELDKLSSQSRELLRTTLEQIKNFYQSKQPLNTIES